MQKLGRLEIQCKHQPNGPLGLNEDLINDRTWTKVKQQHATDKKDICYVKSNRVENILGAIKAAETTLRKRDVTFLYSAVIKGCNS